MLAQAVRTVCRKVIVFLRPVDCTVTLPDNCKDKQERDGCQAAENPGHDQVALLLGQTGGKSGVNDGRRSHGGHQRGQQVEEDAETGQGGALVVVGRQLRQQGGERHTAQGLEGIADHESQCDGDGQGDLVVPGRRPPKQQETCPEGDGKEQQERSAATPAAAHPVGENANQRVVDCIPNDAHQRGNGGQPWIQPNHIGQEDGIKNLAQGTVTGFAPVARSVDQFDPEG